MPGFCRSGHICVLIKFTRKSFLTQPCTGQRPAHAWFLEIAFVLKVDMFACVCVPAPEAINYIHMILNQYNQLNKFVAFINITKFSMHGRGHFNEVRCDRNQPNKAILVP